MKKYKYKEEEFDLEDKDFFLIAAIDHLATEINQLRVNGR